MCSPIFEVICDGSMDRRGSRQVSGLTKRFNSDASERHLVACHDPDGVSIIGQNDGEWLVRLLCARRRRPGVTMTDACSKAQPMVQVVLVILRPLWNVMEVDPEAFRCQSDRFWGEVENHRGYIA
jgi:hypothetical protein